MVALTSIEDHLALIAHVPSGLPAPVAPSTHHFKDLLPGAFAIAIMVFLETLAVARAVRRRSEPQIDNPQEMLAAGLSCAVGSFFRAMPSAGGFSQTAINQGAGARTQLSELVTVVLAVACALFLGSVLSDLPQATLGCMVVIAVLGLISPAELAQFWRLSRVEFWIAVITAACGLIFGMLPAVLVGVTLTLVLVLIELDRVGLTELQPIAGELDVQPADEHTAPLPGLIILRVNGPLYTANVRSTNRKLVAAADARPDTQVVVLDLTAQGRLSLTATHQFSDLEQEFDERGIALWVVAIPPDALKLARQTPRWQEVADAGRLYPTALAAVRSRSWCASCPRCRSSPLRRARASTTGSRRSNPRGTWAVTAAPAERRAAARSAARSPRASTEHAGARYRPDRSRARPRAARPGAGGSAGARSRRRSSGTRCAGRSRRSRRRTCTRRYRSELPVTPAEDRRRTARSSGEGRARTDDRIRENPASGYASSHRAARSRTCSRLSDPWSAVIRWLPISSENASSDRASISCATAPIARNWSRR